MKATFSLTITVDGSNVKLAIGKREGDSDMKTVGVLCDESMRFGKILEKRLKLLKSRPAPFPGRRKRLQKC